MKDKHKNGDANNNPALVIVFGIIFLLAGAGVGAFVFLKSMYVLLAAAIPFVLVGILFIVFAIIRSKIIKKAKILEADANAYVTKAKFVKARFSSYSARSVSVVGVPTTINLKVFKKIFYTYTDQNGVEQKGKSIYSYTENQVQHLRSLGEFDIKCDGKTSVIIEEIPETKATIDYKHGKLNK